MHANEPAMAERWEREGKFVAGVGRLEELSGKWSHVARPPKIGARKPKRTKAAKPAAPARPAAPIVSFATHAAYEQMLDEMYASAKKRSLMAEGGFSRAEAKKLASLIDLDFADEDFTLDAFREGLNVELEHADVTHKRAVATAKIALAHLRERPDYYTKLRAMEDSPVGKASTIMYGGTGASPAPRDPIPDYASIYWQPDSTPNVEREREANENRRNQNAKRNQGKFGFHGGADVEPEIRYDQDDFPMSTRRGMEQSPTKRASTQTAELNAYDQPITTKQQKLVVKRNAPVVEHREASGPQREPKRILGKFSRPANMPPKQGGRIPVAKPPPQSEHSSPKLANQPKLVVKR